MKSSGLNKSGISPAHVRKQRNRKLWNWSPARWQPHAFLSLRSQSYYSPLFSCPCRSSCCRPQRRPCEEPCGRRRDADKPVPVLDRLHVELVPRDERRELERAGKHCSASQVLRRLDRRLGRKPGRRPQRSTHAPDLQKGPLPPDRQPSQHFCQQRKCLQLIIYSIAAAGRELMI